jgi:S-adenosylmethionine:tRNA ribosyltransferase-isomerase
MTAGLLATAGPEPSDLVDFKLSDGRAASMPPEARGIPRDGVRLIVGAHGSNELSHARFRDLPSFLARGDLLVVNASATMNAALDARRANGQEILVHLSTALDDGRWAIELRRIIGDAAAPLLDAQSGERILLPDGSSATLIEPWPFMNAAPGRVRLWAADVPVGIRCLAMEHGRPIRYAYVPERWPLGYYQTVFASEPGSAEMPSAGRPFSAALIRSITTSGVRIAPVVLHTGVSSLESDEPPYPERFRVPRETADTVNATRAAGGRVIAVGTTVVRALESVAALDGTVRPADGWTDLVIGPDRAIRAVHGMITGFHPPRATHLAMLEALAGPLAVASAYRAALHCGYLWHEFGDAHLLLGRTAHSPG